MSSPPDRDPEAPPEERAPTADAASPPLAGLKVLDLSRILAGPYAAQILGDMGADVIKVEHPRGDDTRRWGPPEHEGDAVYYLTANRNKRARAVDFNDPEQLAAVTELAREADVLLENFKVGALTRFKLDYARVSARNPGIVYCSITGFGQTGPYARRPGYDALIQAMGGLMSITGPDRETPTKVGVAIADITTGLYAVIAILAALRERERSGLGQHIDLSLLDTQASWLANIAMNYLTTGDVPEPMGTAHPTIVPYQSFATRDRPLCVAIGNDEQFRRFAARLEAPWADDPRFATNAARVEHRADLVDEIEARLRSRTRAEWLERLEGAGFPFGPVNDLAELASDPHARARSLFTTMDDGRTPCIRSPLRFSRTPIRGYRRPPALDEHPDAEF